MKAHNRTNILIGGVDAMPPAIQAVSEGRMFATVRILRAASTAAPLSPASPP